MVMSSEPIREKKTISVASSDIEEARHMGADLFYPHELHVIGDEASFSMSLSAASIGPVTIGRLEYSSEVEIVTSELGDAYQVNIPIMGDLETRCGTAHTVATPHQGAVYRCDQRTRLRGWGVHGCAPVLAIKFQRHAVEAQLAAQLGVEIHDPIVFDLDLDLDSAYGRQWLTLVNNVCRQFDATDMLALEPMVAQPMAEVLTSGLLLATSHDYRSMLDEPTPPLPRVVQLAIDYMQANASDPLTVACIAGAVGVSVRTLQISFQKALGVTPMRHLKSIRLHRVRVDLHGADPHDSSVTEIARRWGFTHVGRFAGDYRSEFGVSPSHDLRSSDS